MKVPFPLVCPGRSCHHLTCAPGTNPWQSTGGYLWPASLSLHRQFVNLPVLVTGSLFSLCDQVLCAITLISFCYSCLVMPQLHSTAELDFQILVKLSLDSHHAPIPWKETLTTLTCLLFCHCCSQGILEFRSALHLCTRLATWTFTSPSKPKYSTCQVSHTMSLLHEQVSWTC